MNCHFQQFSWFGLQPVDSDVESWIFNDSFYKHPSVGEAQKSTVSSKSFCVPVVKLAAGWPCRAHQRWRGRYPSRMLILAAGNSPALNCGVRSFLRRCGDVLHSYLSVWYSLMLLDWFYQIVITSRRSGNRYLDHFLWFVGTGKIQKKKLPKLQEKAAWSRGLMVISDRLFWIVC